MLELLDHCTPEDPLGDIALTDALLRAVARRERPDTLRLFAPGETLAFGRLDTLRPGFGDAAAAARARGYVPVVRSAGGHAAVYGQRCLVIEHVSYSDDVTVGLTDRFDDQALRLQRALIELQADARIGELAGEYCAGAHSINLGGQIKVAGVAQRTIRHAALTTAVLVVDGGKQLRSTISEIYGALGLETDPARAGALTDVLPGQTIERVAEVIAQTYAPLRPATPVDVRLGVQANSLRARHAVA